MSSSIAFQLNGSAAQVDDAGDEPLLFVLRNRLDLKATHFGCGLEQCGACVVSVDGQARYSCTLPMSALAGAEVTTPEALRDDPVGVALLEAFEAEQAGQCGYCISGILMRIHALFKTERRPGRAAILAALDKHLCRCGAHGSILRAVERAAARLGGEA
ncbi:(2Fe-2S)-binding protein [Shinella granuli]|uniref:Isoquinoline 1-oxidoreductase alpha subunit/nicotinate dehydrogenase subunit A n=1 Tax=Shinella granuli TaxID=323621 RepID=A0A4R2CAR4_SHIGR|nr:2Fe-2S iron-sulfur cluster-binding protein [Shinella granuli]TCN37787.1 isoquinoline 1-oxidoreductase alpha subunit/nicotinate dehydrogenase subunit A [Shinella granuli]